MGTHAVLPSPLAGEGPGLGGADAVRRPSKIANLSAARLPPHHPHLSPTRGERGIVATLLTLIAAFFLTLAPAHAADLKFPALTGRVVDEAHVLPADEAARLTQKLADLEARTSRQLVVVTVNSLQGDDISDYGYKLGRAWKIGQQGTNNGTLFIIAPTEHQTRIEVGYGLEGILTDAMTSVILNSQVLPRFKAGDMPGGIEAGANALIEQMTLDPSEAEKKAAAAKAQVEQQPAGYHYVRHSNPFGWIFPLIFVFFVFGGIFGRRRGGGGGLWPLLFLGSMMGGGGRGGGDWGGGGGGGGGFSGGGGSFGGGGSSGSW